MPSGSELTLVGMSSLIFGDPPLVHAPARGDPRLVPWLTRADLGYLDDFGFGPSINMVATDLAGAILRPSLSRRVRDTLGRGLALHPQLHLLQLPTEELRAHFAAEIALLSEPLEESIDPLANPLTADVAEELAVHLLDLAVQGLGTALLAGSFLMSEPSQVGLDNNLALLAASARYFDEEGLADGADESVRFPRPRQLFATIAIDRRALREEGFMREVLEAYIAAASGLYGYWVQVANLGSTPRASDVRKLSDFLYELERRTMKPVVPDRLGQLGLGYLAGRLSYCIGTGAPEYFPFPPNVAIKTDGTKPKGFAFVTYHAPSLRNFVTQGKYAERGLKAFAQAPCDCGFHDKREPPRGHKAKKLHCLRCRVIQAAAVLAGTPAENVRAFLALVARGEEQSRDIDGDLRIYVALRETLPREAAAGTATG
jgi:hypothetical protein